jgi:hypothetical protein
MDCYCDYETAQAYHSKIRRARKPHKCCECGGAILPSEAYEYHSGIFDGDPFYGHTCERCVDIRTWTTNNVPCLCWAHGNLRADCEEAIVQARERAPDETRGLWFGLLRRIVQRDRINATRRTEYAISS